MLVEFLDRVVELADERRHPHVLKVAQEPDHVYHVSTAEGLKRYEAEARPRAHRAADLSALLAFAQRAADEGQGPCLWYSRQEVVALLSDEERRDQVQLALALSHPLRKLIHLESSRNLWYGQKEFVNLLRIDFAGCLGSAGNLLPLVRQLKFRQLAQSEGVVQHGKASLGKSIETELHGAGSVPEQVILDVPVFLNLLLPTQPVLCALDIDASTEKFSLVPLPGTLEQAQRASEEVIGQALRSGLVESSVPVYYGAVA